MKEEKKKVLIITYYWPPSGGAGVQRWLKFSKYLPEFGWEPVIFTPENPDFDLKDESLLKDINPEIEVLKFPIWEPYKIFKFLSRSKKLNQGQILEGAKTSVFKKLAIWLRGNLFVPDPKRFWIKPSVEYLLSILETNEIKHMITTGPPHSVHLIGRDLKLKNPALTWLADFRDPWTEWTILKQMSISQPVWRRHQRMEKEVLKMADLTLATGPTAAKEFASLGARRTDFVTNGYDQNDYSFNDHKSDDSFFQMTYVGMLSKERNPSVLWEVLDELCQEAEFRDKFQLRITGIISPIVKAEIDVTTYLSQRVSYSDSVEHQEVFKLYARSNLLLLLQSNEEGSYSQLPGKLFEYLGAKRQILALGSIGSDIDNIITETKAGKLLAYNDREGLRSHLKSVVIAKDTTPILGVDKFERRELTRQLAEKLDSL